MLKKPATSPIVAEMEDNMRKKLRYIASKLSSMHTAAIQGVSIVDAALSSDTFNTAFGGEITEKTAKEVFSYYKKRSQPASWWIGPSAESTWASGYLQSAGFVLDEVDVGMVCDLDQMKDFYKWPENFTIRRCKFSSDYADFGFVIAEIFDPPDEKAKIFYSQVAKIDPDQRKDMAFFVGYENGYPVATSCAFFTSVAGIYDIATKKDKRNLGYGSAMLYRALMESKKMGLKKSVLQASSNGLNLYKRFGYKKLCTFSVWNNQLA